MEQHQHLVPPVLSIMRRTLAISGATPVRDVMEMFQKQPNLLALPIEIDGIHTGVINRKTLFFEHLGRPFAVDLYAKKPISSLLGESSFTVEPELDINTALAGLLSVDPELSSDSFPVVLDGKCQGIVAVSDLMMKISLIQTSLLSTLKQLSDRITEEVAKASIIQRELLPPSEQVFDSLTISADLMTSSEIGGDFYDYFRLGNGRIGFVIADVSGHGVQAGMVTTAAKASLHTLIAQGITTPAELLGRMNNAILTTARQTLLMTCLIAIVDLETDSITIANAGHNFPYICRAGSLPQRIEEVTSFPLGFEQNCRYEEWTGSFGCGDTLFLYSDGIIECRSAEGEEFGYGRIEQILAHGPDYSAEELRKRLTEEARKFSCGDSFEDDLTLLIAKKGGAPARKGFNNDADR